MYYLYLKTHNVTKKKYLGFTTRDDYEAYKGSGKYWKRHIDKHGYDVKTEILLYTDDYNDLVETSVFFSKLFNVINNKDFANLMDENGVGGDTSKFRKYKTGKKEYWEKNKDKLHERNEKISLSVSKTKNSKQWKESTGICVSMKAKERQNDPDWKNNQGVIISQKAKDRWSNEEYKRNVSHKISEKQKDPEWIKLHYKQCQFCNEFKAPGGYKSHIRACEKKRRDEKTS